MQSDTKYILVLLGINTLANLIFLYRYSNIEFNLQTDTDIIVRKIIGLENKLSKLAGRQPSP